MMSEAEFFAGITGSENDFALVIRALAASGEAFCLIGGLAVNRYAEPVVTLDADFAIAAAGGAAEALREFGFEVKEFPHSLNAQLPGSRLRIQITVNSRYACFPGRAEDWEMFGVRVPVARIEDVVQGKVWAASDETRRPTRRQKDRLDLARLAESNAEVISLIPAGLVPEVDAMRA